MAGNEIQTPRKITLKGIGAQADIEKLMSADGRRMKLAHVYGVATRAKPGQTDTGPYVKFLGQFRAVNLATKEVFESSAIILPRFIEEGLFAALPDGGGNVEFAVEISAKFDKDAATKYVYESKSLLPTQENAQLAQLETRVKEAAKALVAPKQ
jgi:hypothetical protein